MFYNRDGAGGRPARAAPSVHTWPPLRSCGDAHTGVAREALDPAVVLLRTRVLSGGGGVCARMCAHVVCGGCEDAVQLCMGERRCSGDAASGAALALGGGGGGVLANDVRAHSHACAVEAGGCICPAPTASAHEQGEREAERERD